MDIDRTRIPEVETANPPAMNQIKSNIFRPLTECRNLDTSMAATRQPALFRKSAADQASTRRVSGPSASTELSSGYPAAAKAGETQATASAARAASRSPMRMPDRPGTNDPKKPR